MGTDQQMDDLLKQEDLKFSREQLLGPITDMQAYQINKQSLHCSDLEGNLLFTNLRERVFKFFISNEEVRRYGQSQKQLS